MSQSRNSLQSPHSQSKPSPTPTSSISRGFEISNKAKAQSMHQPMTESMHQQPMHQPIHSQFQANPSRLGNELNSGPNSRNLASNHVHNSINMHNITYTPHITSQSSEKRLNYGAQSQISHQDGPRRAIEMNLLSFSPSIHTESVQEPNNKRYTTNQVINVGNQTPPRQPSHYYQHNHINQSNTLHPIPNTSVLENGKGLTSSNRQYSSSLRPPLSESVKNRTEHTLYAQQNKEEYAEGHNTQQSGNDDDSEIDDSQFLENIPRDEELQRLDDHDENEEDANEEDFIEGDINENFTQSFGARTRSPITMSAEVRRGENLNSTEYSHYKQEFNQNLIPQSYEDDRNDAQKYEDTRNYENIHSKAVYRREYIQDEQQFGGYQGDQEMLYEEDEGHLSNDMQLTRESSNSQVQAHLTNEAKNSPIRTLTTIETIEDIPKHLQKELTSKIRKELSTMVHKELKKIRKESEKIMQQELQGLSQVDMLKKRVSELEKRLSESSASKIHIETQLQEVTAQLKKENEKYSVLKQQYANLEANHKKALHTITDQERNISDKTRAIMELEQRLHKLHQRKDFEEQYQSSKAQKLTKHVTTFKDETRQIEFTDTSQSTLNILKEENNSVNSNDDIRAEDLSDSVIGEDTLNLNMSQMAHTSTIPSFTDSISGNFDSSNKSNSNNSLAQNQPSRLQMLSGMNSSHQSFDQWIEEERLSPQHEYRGETPNHQDFGTVLSDLLNQNDPQTIAQTLIHQARDPQFKQSSTNQFAPTLSHGQTTSAFVQNITLPQTVQSPETPKGSTNVPKSTSLLNNPIQSIQHQASTEDDTPKRSRFTSRASGTLKNEKDAKNQKQINVQSKQKRDQERKHVTKNINAKNTAPSTATTKRSVSKYEELLRQSSIKRQGKSPKKGQTAKSKGDKLNELKEALDEYEALVSDWEQQQASGQENFSRNVNILKAFIVAVSHKSPEFSEIVTRISRLLDTLYNIWENLETSFTDRNEYTSNIINALRVDTILPAQVLIQSLQLVENDLGKVIHVSTQELLKQTQLISIVRQREAALVKLENLSMKKSGDRGTLIQQLKQFDRDLAPLLQQWHKKEGIDFEYRGIPYENILKYQILKKEVQQLETEKQHILKWAKRSAV